VVVNRTLRLLAALLACTLAVAACPAYAGQSQLAVARSSLVAAERAERDARSQLEAERAAGRLSGRALEDFGAWVRELHQEVERQRALVAWLERRAARLPGAGGPPPAGADRFVYTPAPTLAEKVSALDGRLEASLGEFDEMLLREQRLLSERARRDGAEEGAGGAGGGGGGQGSWAEGAAAAEGSQGTERPGTEAARAAASAGEGERLEGVEAGAEAGVAGARGPSTVAAAGGAGEERGAGAARAVPPGIPDGRDDDIVARQIREAAERETDPDLRRKLWDEYRRYKNANR
jgi:hypothetical protein